MPRASGPVSGVPGLFHGGRREPRSQRKVRANGLPIFFQVLPYLGSHEDLSWSPLEQIPSLFTIFQAVPKVAGPLAGSCPDPHPPTQPAFLGACSLASPPRALVRVLSLSDLILPRPVQRRFPFVGREILSILPVCDLSMVEIHPHDDRRG